MVAGVLTGGVRGGVGLLPVALLGGVIRVGTSAHPTDDAGGSALRASAAKGFRRVGTRAHAVSPVEQLRMRQTNWPHTHHTNATTARSANNASAAAGGSGLLM